MTARLVTGRPKAVADAQRRRSRAVLAGASAVLDNLDAAVDPRTPEAALADLDRVLGPDPAAGRRLAEEDLPLQGFWSDYGDEIPILFTGSADQYREEVRRSLVARELVDALEEVRYIAAMRRAHLDGMPDYEEFYGPRSEPALVLRTTGSWFRVGTLTDTMRSTVRMTDNLRVER